MKITYDKKSNMLNIQLVDKPSVESEEINGVVFDFDENSKIVSIEIENAQSFDFSTITFETLNQKIG